MQLSAGDPADKVARVTSTLLWIAVGLFCAGGVKGVFGMGLPTVSIGLLSLFMPPVEAATLIVIPTLATNAWQFATGPRPMAVAVRFAVLLIGVLILYAAVGILAPHLPVPSARAERWMSPLIGVATGVVNGATGVSVMPLVPYLNSIGLQREALIEAMGLVFMVAMLALAICLAWTGHFEVASAGASTLALLPVFAGMYAGQLLRRRLHAGVYRKWFFIGLFALGASSIIRAMISA